jgi:diguanylate cyclase
MAVQQRSKGDVNSRTTFAVSLKGGNVIVGGRRIPGFLLGAGLGLVYAGLAIAIATISSFSNSGAGVSSFWPASGITVVALLMVRRRNWPWLLAGIWIAEVAVDLHSHVVFSVASGWGTANAVEPLCSALLVGRLVKGRPDLARRDHLIRFVGAAVVCGPIVSSLVATVTVALNTPTDFLLTAVRWFVGDAIGVVTIAPALLVLTNRRAKGSKFPFGVLMLAAVFGVITFGPFNALKQNALAFFTVPTIIWLTLRGGEYAAAFSVLVIALITNAATAAGWGPFAVDNGAFSGLVEAQVFLGTVALSALTVAVLTNDLVRREIVEAMLFDQANHDALTGLANRRAMPAAFTIDRAEANSSGQLVASLMIDLDNFKIINDTYGHDVGDAILVETGRRLEASTRPGDVVYRLGGDEFVVTLDRPSSVDEVVAISGRLTRILEHPISVDGRQMEIGASVGWATTALWDSDPETLLRMADDEMYRIKLGKRSATALPSLALDAKRQHPGDFPARA